jgi:hypothetical protein
VIDRTLIALAAGVAAFFIALAGAWILVSAYEKIGWQVPLAAGVAVALALWVVDFLTDELAKRQK